ncbi:hypothetical protein HEP81_00959 [Streptomyces griseofuscus]|uniref:Uncharacterized protein n=1 Tax=Streptomyces griseofuscus TaxID=146922 RepID=A0A7H1PTB3_9ACTN|nr:hypothetical protein HEP81_00959 [Streptomyces griseofuscus]
MSAIPALSELAEIGVIGGTGRINSWRMPVSSTSTVSRPTS